MSKQQAEDVARMSDVTVRDNPPELRHEWQPLDDRPEHWVLGASGESSGTRSQPGT